jgi:hypothetical protein
VGSVICSFNRHLCKATLSVAQIIPVIASEMQSYVNKFQCAKNVYIFILYTLNYFPFDLLNFMRDLPQDRPTKSVRFPWGVIIKGQQKLCHSNSKCL